MSNTKIKLNLDSLKSRREWKRHKVKDGHNVFRILPPFGEASNGYPYRKWQIIWGLTDPESGRARPFASSMTSEKRCPVTEFVDQLKVKAESVESQLKASGASEDDVKARLKDLRELISNLSPKTVYIYNAADRAGEVGLLELKSTAHKKMKTVMNQYIQDYNQDPTSLNSANDDSGVWFDITRTGQFRDTEYDVIKLQTKQKTPEGRLVFADDRSPLPDAVVENYDNLAYDLSSVYQVKTYDELQEILDYNLSGIVSLVPDANLGADIAAPVLEKKLATKSTVSNKVTTKIDDGDDDGEEENSNGGSTTLTGARGATSANFAAKTANVVNKAASNKTNMLADDEFMAEADAILNG